MIRDQPGDPVSNGVICFDFEGSWRLCCAFRMTGLNGAHVTYEFDTSIITVYTRYMYCICVYKCIYIYLYTHMTFYRMILSLHSCQVFHIRHVLYIIKHIYIYMYDI